MIASLDIVSESPADHSDAIEALYDSTFGPGHFAKTAERLREFNASLPDLNRVALSDGRVVGVVRLWPLVVESGHRAVFVGPVAVAHAHRGARLSVELTRRALSAAGQAGWEAALLVGAPTLFGEAGFRRAQPGRLRLPGPVDAARLLIADLIGDADAMAGSVSAPRAATPGSRSQAPE